MRRLRFLALLLPLLLASARPMAPASITVGGACNLNAAIAAANTDLPVGGCTAGSGADVIRLTGTVLLTMVDHVEDGPNGLPSVSTKITIEGGGETVVRDFVSAPLFRIFRIAPSGDLTLQDLLVSFGEVESRGGGIYNLGTLTLRNTTVGPNIVSRGTDYFPFSPSGGGIFNSGTAKLYNSRIISNTASYDDDAASGGGVYSDYQSVLLIESSTIAGNRAKGYQGKGGGVFAFSASDLTIENSTISDNVADGVSNAGGGGLLVRGSFTITNTTISGNSAQAALMSYGGGFASATADAVGSLAHVTFSGNSAAYAAALFGGTGVTVSGSLFADSSTHHCGGSFTDGGGGNLADDLTCKLTIAGTLAGVDTTLADHGGPTETHQLLAGSTAIDVSGDCGLATDQRGAARITSCDSGAFELIGCDLLELDEQVIDSVIEQTACHSALLGPDLIVEESGSLQVTAGYLVTIKDDVVVESGGALSVILDP